MPSQVPEHADEEYLDCAGTSRTFRLSTYADGLFLEAAEFRKGEPTGLRFILPCRDGEPEPWGPMRTLIRERLSQRDIVRDAKGKLHLLRRTVRAQLSDRDSMETGLPTLLVDDLELTWDELGELLAPFAGFGLRIEIRECGEE